MHPTRTAGAHMASTSSDMGTPTRAKAHAVARPCRRALAARRVPGPDAPRGCGAAFSGGHPRVARGPGAASFGPPQPEVAGFLGAAPPPSWPSRARLLQPPLRAGQPRPRGAGRPDARGEGPGPRRGTARGPRSGGPALAYTPCPRRTTPPRAGRRGVSWARSAQQRRRRSA